MTTTAAAPRFFGSRDMTNRAGAVLAVEHVVRVGDLEARARVAPGEQPVCWTLAWTRNGRRYTHEIAAEDLRGHGVRLQAVEKAAKRLCAA